MKDERSTGGASLEIEGHNMQPVAQLVLTPLQKAFAALMFVIAVAALIIAVVALGKANDVNLDDYAKTSDVVTQSSLDTIDSRVDGLDARVADINSDLDAAGGISQSDLDAALAGKADVSYVDSSVSAASGKTSGLIIQLTDHADPNDGFWIPVRQGYNEAEKLLGIGTDFQPGEGDFDQMVSRITDASRRQVDGLVVSLWSDDSRFRDAIEEGLNNQIPIISINSGITNFADWGVSVHVGQDEIAAGTGIAERMIEDLASKNAGATYKALCINHAGSNNVGTRQRCEAFEAAMAAADPPHETETWLMPDGFNFGVDADVNTFKQTIDNYVNNDGISAILTLNNNVAIYTAEAVEDAGKKSTVDISTFDIDAAVVDAIQNDHIDFAIDQQPYLQGFLPIALLNLKALYDLMIVDQIALQSGPYIVSKSIANNYKTRDYADPSTALKQPEDIRVAFVAHGTNQDEFWIRVRNAVKKAGRDFGISAEYRHPTEEALVNDDDVLKTMTNMIDAYTQEPAESRVDGIVISIPSCPGASSSTAVNTAADNFKLRVEAAMRAGIPVYSINSGNDCWQDFRGDSSLQTISGHIGQDESLGGTRVGEFLSNTYSSTTSGGPERKVLCVDHEPSNTALLARCNQISAALTADSGWGSSYSGFTRMAFDASLGTTLQDQIASAISGFSADDVIVALGPTGAQPALAASGSTGPMVGTFDLDFGVLESMAAGGKGIFCVDQQQYLQGYLPVMFHYLNARWGNGLPRQFIPTGPNVISNHAQATHLLRLIEDMIR